MADESKVSVGPVREDGTMHMQIKQPDGTLLGLTVATKPSSSLALETQVKALKERKAQAALAGSRNGGLRWEKGLWRIYVVIAAVWGFGIAGMLALSLIASGRIHRDVLDSCLVAAVVLPGILCGYFLVKAIVRYVFWPPMKWVIEGFIQK
jgi:hypothetical protein